VTVDDVDRKFAFEFLRKLGTHSLSKSETAAGLEIRTITVQYFNAAHNRLAMKRSGIASPS